MKKLLIGCGCLVLLVLGAGAWFVMQLAPGFTQMQDGVADAAMRMHALDHAHPFDPDSQEELDAERFATALDVRIGLKDDYERWEAKMEALDPGDGAEAFKNLIAAATGAMELMAEQFALVPTALEGTAMSPKEFVFHSKVLWATLDSIGAGAGGDAFDSDLRGQYDIMVGAYGEIRQSDPNLPTSFDALVGEVAPGLVITARQVLASDPLRAESAIAQPGMEVLLLDLQRTLDQAMAELDIDEATLESVQAPVEAPIDDEGAR